MNAEIESGFVAKDDLVPFCCSLVSSSKRRCRWVGVKGSTLNRRRDPKCPSARCLRMVQEHTGGPSEKVLPVPGWRPMKQLAVRMHFLRCGGLLDD
ncbi:hypothetical protein TNCV_1065641 [Trichonephila clavipes]|nr:hypothetical protein TNCV_1065641 [Trichonephila clavipes]